MIVTRYGVHWAPGGIPFLVQSEGAQNLISRTLESPFVVNVRPRRIQCPHSIDLTQSAQADWLQDPLAAVFLPTPHTGGKPAQMILNPPDQLLLQLQRLYSPTLPMLRPIWFTENARETANYAVTNLGPMVFLGATLATMRFVYRQIELGRTNNRRVLIVARERLPVFGDGEWISTELKDVSREPLEALGAGALKDHMSNVHA